MATGIACELVGGPNDGKRFFIPSDQIRSEFREEFLRRGSNVALKEVGRRIYKYRGLSGVGTGYVLYDFVREEVAD